MTPLARRVVLIGTAMSLVCCGEPQADANAAFEGIPEFAIAGTPTLVIADDGSPDKLFAGISARRIGGGRIVVADRGSAELRVFDRNGSLITRLAQRGEGPGELEGQFVIRTIGDTVFVIGTQSSSRMVSIFTLGDGFLGRFRPTADSAPHGMVATDRLSSGEFVVEAGTGFRVMAAPPTLGRLDPDSVTIGLFTPQSGEREGHVIWLPGTRGGWLYAFPWPNGPIPSGASAYTLGHTIEIAASGDRLWVADSETGRLRAIDGIGREVATAQLPLTPIAFERAELARAPTRALAVASTELDRSKVDALYDPALLPPTKPLLSALLPGPSGEVWVRVFSFDAHAAPRYLVISADGRVTAQATLPVDVQVEQIGTDFVLGIRRDSLGVESVVEYALQR